MSFLNTLAIAFLVQYIIFKNVRPITNIYQYITGGDIEISLHQYVLSVNESETVWSTTEFWTLHRFIENNSPMLELLSIEVCSHEIVDNIEDIGFMLDSVECFNETSLDNIGPIFEYQQNILNMNLSAGFKLNYRKNHYFLADSKYFGGYCDTVEMVGTHKETRQLFKEHGYNLASVYYHRKNCTDPIPIRSL
jgi:hypothetical protein